ncbi:MAG: sugar ABC transporter permease [Spartobacteria bacterium]|nr:sugar ABC transporter permease [Spartobacteria bacterium]
MVKQKSRYLSDRTAAWFYLAPALILLSIFVLYPTVKLFLTGFYEWDGMGDKTYIGLTNYRFLLQDSEFWYTVKNSFIFILGTVPTGMALALVLALLLQKKIRGRGLFRTLFFSPVVTSLVAAGLIWVWLLNYDYGIINRLLMQLGFEKIPWLVSDQYAMLSVIMMTIWKDAGYNMILFLAGLSTISSTYYEAARIDGASTWQSFWSITWPLLMPTTIFIMVVRIIFSFRTFEQIYAMTKGGPTGSTTVFVYYIYEKAFQGFEVGYASAAAMVLLVLVLFFTGLQFAVTRKMRRVT